MCIERSVNVSIDYNAKDATHIDPGFGNDTDFDIVDERDFDFELEAYLESIMERIN